MSSTNGAEGNGAASAAPGLPAIQTGTVVTPVQAAELEAGFIAALDQVQTPDQAEVLLARTDIAERCIRLSKLGADYEQRWRGFKLKAERRYGELLPPPQPVGRPAAPESESKQPSSTEPTAEPAGEIIQPEQFSDRNVVNRARKVAEVPKDKFDNYVENDPKPSRAGLLRTVMGPSTQRRSDHKTKAKPAGKPADPRSRHGKKLTKAERTGVLWKLHDMVMDFTAQLERIDPRVCDVSDDPVKLDTLVHIRDALIDLDIWKGDVERIINGKIGDQGIREKIATLRNPNGKYPAELKRCQEAADRLEKRLENKLSGGSSR